MPKEKVCHKCQRPFKKFTTFENIKEYIRYYSLSACRTCYRKAVKELEGEIIKEVCYYCKGEFKRVEITQIEAGIVYDANIPLYKNVCLNCKEKLINICSECKQGFKKSN